MHPEPPGSSRVQTLRPRTEEQQDEGTQRKEGKQEAELHTASPGHYSAASIYLATCPIGSYHCPKRMEEVGAPHVSVVPCPTKTVPPSM